jgi:hypothetical protein
MKTVKKCILLVAILMGFHLLQGCTHVGPFVSSIAFDGQGNLLVTKQTIKFDPFFAILSAEKEQTILIRMK